MKINKRKKCELIYLHRGNVKFIVPRDTNYWPTRSPVDVSGNKCIVESCIKRHNHNPPLLCRERINHILINNHKINSYTSLFLTYFVIKYMNRVEELALPIQTLTYRIEGQIDCLYKLEYLY
jgi:hypothetical protein